jgi:hypothetical protein
MEYSLVKAFYILRITHTVSGSFGGWMDAER